MIPASDFLCKFASDRSHMRGSDGKWLSPPPDYPCIATPGKSWGPLVEMEFLSVVLVQVITAGPSRQQHATTKYCLPVF